MSVGIELAQLIAYTDHERAKWKVWFEADPSRLGVPFQTGGRFATIGNLLNHIFWVEERHLARLQGRPVPETSGAPDNDLRALFEYGDRVRGELHRFVTAVDDRRGAEAITFALRDLPPVTMLRRKLAAHIFLHEVRHLAQIAYAARVAGHEPPGEHDYFFSPVDR
jgi:uncharacterized damage-inducible protein DinB